jgi:RecA-family ATPase
MVPRTLPTDRMEMTMLPTASTDNFTARPQATPKSTLPSALNPTVLTTDTCTWGEFLSSPPPPTPFMIDSLVPRQGIVLLHGKKSLGKSPLVWEMARSVALGIPFLGAYPTHQGTVVFIEADTPAALVWPRLNLLPGPTSPNLIFHFARPFNVLENAHAEMKRLHAVNSCHHPAFVIVNTLRKVFRGDMNDSDIPSPVYMAFQRVFPQAAIVFVHHDKKSTLEGTNPDEQFSGSMAWLNDAQVGLHLTKAKTGHQGELDLKVTGNQTADNVGEVMALYLDPDGTRITLQEAEKTKRILTAYQATDPSLTQGKRIKQVSDQLGEGYSERTVWGILKRALAGVHTGRAKIKELEASQNLP